MNSGEIATRLWYVMLESRASYPFGVASLVKIVGLHGHLAEVECFHSAHFEGSRSL